MIFHFLKVLTLVFLALFPSIIYLSINRPKVPKSKLFSSHSVKIKIQELSKLIKNKKLFSIYKNCFLDTLSNSVHYRHKNNIFDTYVSTGDIHAMWQRDSTFQIFAYLSFTKNERDLQKIIKGVIHRQIVNMGIDIYANAFKRHPKDYSPNNDITTKLLKNHTRVDGNNINIYERKYELCSPGAVFFLSNEYYKQTNDNSFIDQNYINGVKQFIDLISNEMKSTEEEDELYGPYYTFFRPGGDNLSNIENRRGASAGKCDMVKSQFRNSDDSSIYPYNIPCNAFIVNQLESIAIILEKNLINLDEYKGIINDLKFFSSKIRQSIYKNGIAKDENGKEYFLYEVDCLGKSVFMDDANFPNLISLPFFGFLDQNDDIYLNTRKKILSRENPYYFKGKMGDGVGSPHISAEYIWPLFTIMRGLTTSDKNEIYGCLVQLYKVGKVTGYMHESFYKDNPKYYTRPWFGWANSFFAHFINQISEKFPDLLLNI